jgi:hypothetical protein
VAAPADGLPLDSVGDSHGQIAHAVSVSRPTADNTEYTVLLKSRSGARVHRGYYIDLSDFPDGLGGEVQVRISTRWEDLRLDYPAPRELWMAVRSTAPGVDAAVRSAANAASAIAMLVSFCVNAVVEPPALHATFNSTAGLSRREFMEVFVPDESGLPRMGRWIDVDSLFAFGQAALATAEAPRVIRALAQYQAALRYWNIGSRVLVLAHLYIACEVLTKAVQRVHQARLGLSEREHARLLGVDVAQSNWRMMAGNFARREYIFEGDRRVYDAARKASDDFEHGKADLGGVRQAADSVTRELFDLVRSAMLSVVPSLDQAVADQIMSKGPVDVSPLYKQVTGYIISDGPSDPLSLGVAGELFPTLRWRSGIKACRLEDDKVVFEPEETFTVQFAPGLRFETRDLAIYGGLNPSPADVTVPRPSGWEQGDWAARQVATASQAVQPVKRDLLPAVMPLVDAAAATGAGIAQTFPAVLAFPLFGQGVAYFQGARTLIGSRQPAEALPLLRGLVTIAARFEQMTGEHGEGLGLVVRLALDSLDLGNANTQADATRSNLLQATATAGVAVPDQLRTVESAEIWRSLTAEMQIAGRAVDHSYGIVGLHMKDAGHTNTVGFETGQRPGPFTDLIASACVIAQLELLRRAAPIFGWTIDAEAISALIAEAKELNEASARSV